MEVPKAVAEPSGVRLSDFDFDEGRPGGSEVAAAGRAVAEAAEGPPQEILSAFQLEGDESLPRPAPIRTSSMNKLRKKVAQQVVSEIEEEGEEVKEEEAGGRTEGKGWAGWGVGSVGGLLKKVAADMAEDVKELAGSLQQAFQEDDGKRGKGGMDGGCDESDLCLQAYRQAR